MLNTDTLDVLYEAAIENLPDKQLWLNPEPDAEYDRYVVVGEEVFEDTVLRGFGGCWPMLADALSSYDWNAGAPVFVIDLFAEPAAALIDVKLTPSAGARRSFRDPNGGPAL